MLNPPVYAAPPPRSWLARLCCSMRCAPGASGPAAGAPRPRPRPLPPYRTSRRAPRKKQHPPVRW
eukprot:3232290-Ditylum_brightwellii.AAC.1